MSFSPTFATLFLLGVVAARESRAQADNRSVSSLAARLASLSAVTGYEQAMVDTILRLLPGYTRDRAGNVRLPLGAGSVKCLIVCPLDEPGYVVGNVRQDGYLTLRRVPGHMRIGWPIRYSPAETIDLRDVVSLADMIQAVAERW